MRFEQREGLDGLLASFIQGFVIVRFVRNTWSLFTWCRLVLCWNVVHCLRFLQQHSRNRQKTFCKAGAVRWYCPLLPLSIAASHGMLAEDLEALHLDLPRVQKAQP